MNKKLYTAVAIGIAACTWADEVQFSELPKSVQTTVNRNLNGGVVQEIEREARSGRTVYEVEVRREGRNSHLHVDADGKLLSTNNGLEVNVDGNDIFDKNDGKILGVVDKPGDDDANLDAEAKIGDSKVKLETDIDKPRVRDRDLNASVDVDADADDGKIEVETRAGKEKKVFNKNDGKLFGLIPWSKKNTRNHVDTDRNAVTTDVDGGLDTDDNDGRILGVPKRGYETLSLRDVPPRVRETITRAAGGARVAEIEVAEENGRKVYEVDIERDGKNRELHIAADGTIVKDNETQAIGRPGTTTRGTGRND